MSEETPQLPGRLDRDDLTEEQNRKLELYLEQGIDPGGEIRSLLGLTDETDQSDKDIPLDPESSKRALENLKRMDRDRDPAEFK